MITHRIVFIATSFLAVLVAVRGFQPLVRPQKDVKQFRGLLHSSSLRNHGTDDDVSEAAAAAHITTDVPSWSIQEDWALIDQVPRFTVGEGDQARTFWSQLLSASPLLSRRTELELMEHCLTITTKAKTQTEYPSKILFGPSPSILDHWMVSPDGRLSGQTEQGRRVWMTTHAMGRLGDDPLSDPLLAGSDGVCHSLPGGYAEAVGGRVYELGQPHKEQYAQQLSQQAQVPSPSEPEKKGLAWWVPATTATFSALFASSILSACIGYGAGMSMLPDGHTRQVDTSTHLLVPSSQVRITASASTKVNKAEYAPTISEIRARTEARVLREQRMIGTIQGRLEKDEVTLSQLRQDEQQQLQANWNGQ